MPHFCAYLQKNDPNLPNLTVTTFQVLKELDLLNRYIALAYRLYCIFYSPTRADISLLYLLLL